MLMLYAVLMLVLRWFSMTHYFDSKLRLRRY